jgi:hypothetical protein
MKGENCTAYATELMECGRGGLQPSDSLDRHLDSCGVCRERWEAQKQVTAGLRAVRIRAAEHSSSLESRQRVLHAFDRQYARTVAHSRNRNAWMWGLAAAAMLLIMAGVLVPRLSQLSRLSHSRTSSSVVAVAADGAAADVSSRDAGSLTNDDFVAVPYAPPLASGELVRIVHADLDPETLVRLGFNPDPAWTEDFPADVVVGEDGYPRAVRISDDSQ